MFLRRKLKLGAREIIKDTLGHIQVTGINSLSDVTVESLDVVPLKDRKMEVPANESVLQPFQDALKFNKTHLRKFKVIIKLNYFIILRNWKSRALMKGVTFLWISVYFYVWNFHAKFTPKITQQLNEIPSLILQV